MGECRPFSSRANRWCHYWRTFFNIIARGAPDFAVSNRFAANGYGEHSPGHYDVLSCFSN